MKKSNTAIELLDFDGSDYDIIHSNIEQACRAHLMNPAESQVFGELKVKDLARISKFIADTSLRYLKIVAEEIRAKIPEGTTVVRHETVK